MPIFSSKKVESQGGRLHHTTALGRRHIYPVFNRGGKTRRERGRADWRQTADKSPLPQVVGGTWD